MRIEADDTALEIVTELNEWWVQLTDGTSIRIWASSYGIEGDSIVFDALLRESTGNRLLELAIVPLKSVVRLESGTGINGLPTMVTKHRYGSKRAYWLEEEQDPKASKA